MQPGSSLSLDEDDMVTSNYQSLKTSIEALKEMMNEGKM